MAAAPDSELGEEGEFYAVERFVARGVDSDSHAALIRVRWEGYSQAHDTWCTVPQLKADLGLPLYYQYFADVIDLPPLIMHTAYE